MSERDLRESYLPHFETGIRDGGAYSLMCAYNRIDGQAACAQQTLEKDILRGEWKFPGYIVSDCGAIDDIYLRHKVAPTAAAAAALAVKTGTDLDCGRVYPNLVDAVKQGLITEAQIDTSVKRLFLARMKLGMFDAPEHVKWAQIPYSVLDDSAHKRLARQVARESIVLLKNADRRSAAAQEPRHHRRDRTQCRSEAHAARQLQRRAVRSRHAATRHSRGGVAATKVLYARGSDLADDFPVLDVARRHRCFRQPGCASSTSPARRWTRRSTRAPTRRSTPSGPMDRRARD